MKSNEQAGEKSLNEILKQSDEVISSSWLKLAQLVMVAEQISWKQATAKANQLYNSQEAQEYIDLVRSSVKSSPDNLESKASSELSAKRDQYTLNYKRLLKIIPDLEQNLSENKHGLHGKSSVTGYMDLHFDLLNSGKGGYFAALSHYYKQNGDMIPDPDMVIRIDVKNQTVEALTYQDVYGYKEVYDNYMNPKTVMPSEKKAQNSFLTNWLRNLIQQGHEIEFDDSENEPTQKPKSPKKEQENAKNPNSMRPDISFMDEKVVAELKKLANDYSLEELLKLVMEKDQGKQTLRAVAEYFLVDRINNSALGVSFSYPSQEAITADYELLAAQHEQKNRTTGKDNLADSNHSKTKTHQKLNRQESSTANELFKVNYQLLTQLIPEITDSKVEDLKGLLKSTKKDSTDFLFEGMEPMNNRVETLSIQGSTKETDGLLFLAINRQSKKVWLINRVGNFDGKSDFQSEGSEPYDNLKANKQVGDWLLKLSRQGYKSKLLANNQTLQDDWDEQEINSKIPDFQPGKVKLVEAHIRLGLEQKDIDWINEHKRGMTITPLKNMKNKTSNYEADMAIKALKPGFRISRTGKLYRENRSNRSDLTGSGL